MAKTVFVIESYHKEYKWDADFIDGLTDSIEKKYRTVYFEMNTKRLPSSQFNERADLAFKKYQEVKPDVVVLCDDNALKLLGPRFQKEDVPVIFLGINNNPRMYGIKIGKNITGILERPLLHRSLITIKKVLKGNPKKGLILYDSSTTANASVEVNFKGEKSINLWGMNIELKLVDTFKEWKKYISNAKSEGYDFVVIGLYHTLTNNGKHIDAKKVMKWTSENSVVPPFSFWSFGVGADKAIGGLVLYGRIQGLMAGELVNKVLNGDDIKKIYPIMAEKGRLLFSRYQLNKWGITLSQDLEEKAEILD
jgi:ABC-type uncharacterized transport system substrate-binding protein